MFSSYRLLCLSGCYQHSVSYSEQERWTRRWSDRNGKEEEEERVHPASTNHLHLQWLVRENGGFVWNWPTSTCLQVLVVLPVKEKWFYFSLLLDMLQLSGRSGSRPSSWPSRRLSLPASLRGWQRSAVHTGATYLHSRSRVSTLMLRSCWQISLRQGMKVDTGALMSLCEKTDNDIRACINTLQVCRIIGEPTFQLSSLQTTLTLCTVPLRPWPEAGGRQDHSGCLCGAEGPEQRPVLSVAGDLPVTTDETVQDDERVEKISEYLEGWFFSLEMEICHHRMCKKRVKYPK